MLIKKLTDANGLPTYEDEVRDAIKEEIKDYVDRMFVDRMGNLIAVKNENAPGRHIALSAHMDEVGMVVKSFDKSGVIKFRSWGVDPRVMLSKVVRIGKDKIPGVIGSKPIHMQKPDERKTNLELDKLYIDIGVDSDEEAKKCVEIGDYIAFDSEYHELGNHKIKAKALDDRVGCAAIIETLKANLPYKLTAVFCVQEEVGLRGSATASNHVFADLVLNLEGTVCADTWNTDDMPEHLRVTVLGQGPAISLKDRTSIYLKKYYEQVIAVAEENNIPYQFRGSGAGGTDAFSYHVAHGGTPVVGLAVPCRYLHTPVSVCDIRDYENLVLLLNKFISKYNEEEAK